MKTRQASQQTASNSSIKQASPHREDKGQREREAERERERERERSQPPTHNFCFLQATADKRRQEAAEKQREREAQAAEKAGRANKRRKQHALLSKRTRGGQPVMKNTMKHLLEKIQSQQR